MLLHTGTQACIHTEQKHAHTHPHMHTQSQHLHKLNKHEHAHALHTLPQKLNDHNHTCANAHTLKGTKMSSLNSAFGEIRVTERGKKSHQLPSP